MFLSIILLHLLVAMTNVVSRRNPLLPYCILLSCGRHIGRITRLAVRPSVPYGFLTRKRKSAECGVNVLQLWVTGVSIFELNKSNDNHHNL